MKNSDVIKEWVDQIATVLDTEGVELNRIAIEFYEDDHFARFELGGTRLGRRLGLVDERFICAECDEVHPDHESSSEVDPEHARWEAVNTDA